MKYSTFGIEARNIMLQKDIKVKDLAATLGISNSYMSEILKGTRDGNKYKMRIVAILKMEEKN